MGSIREWRLAAAMAIVGLFGMCPWGSASPSVAWGTYMGGASSEDAYGVAVDSQGNI